MTKYDFEKIGDFEVTSSLVVTDPCYIENKEDIVKNADAILKFNNAKKGKWNVWAKSEKNVTHSLVAQSADCGDHLSFSQMRLFGSIGVDSGQAGIFDEDMMCVPPDLNLFIDPDKIIDKDNMWYSICCDVTLYSDSGHGTIPGGAISSSGYGDGSYSVYVRKDDNGVVECIHIDFVTEDDEDDEDEEY